MTTNSTESSKISSKTSTSRSSDRSGRFRWGPTDGTAVADRAAIAVFLVVILPTTAVAQESSADSETSDTRQTEGEVDPKVEEPESENISDLTKSQKKRLSTLLDEAETNYANGKFETVVEQMKEAYSIYPEPEFLFRIALSYERAGVREQAVEYYERYLDEKPDTDKRGRVERSLGQLRQKIREEKTERNRRQAPVLLTTVGSVFGVTSISFGIVNLAVKSRVDETIEKGPEDGPISSASEFREAVFWQNLSAGITWGAGAISGVTLTWALIQWLQMPGPSDAETEASTAEAPGSFRDASLELQLHVGPRTVGISGRF